MKEFAYLFGPVIGSLEWEYMYFAPYVIHLAKTNPEKRIIVFTRKSRFDLYGKHVDLFVPLKIPHDDDLEKVGFKIKGFRQEDFNVLLREYVNKYKNRFKVIDHIYPDIKEYSYKIKWQFPKENMDYDFKPRHMNEVVADKFASSSDYDCLVDEGMYNLPQINYRPKSMDYYISQFTKFIDGGKITKLGCFIEAIKRVDFVIGNLKLDVSKLSLLLKKPLITINETLTDDSIGLINPLNTPVIKCDDIEKGIEIYENNFRFEECGGGK